MQFAMAWTVIAATRFVTAKLLTAPPEHRYCATRPRRGHRS